MKKDDFAVFILTNGRPENVITYKTLIASGYTGKTYIIIDDLDKTRDKYLEIYKEKVIIFNKKEIAKTFDQGDNFEDMRAIIYARNASFEIAKKLSLKGFIQLDDDYTDFSYRFDGEMNCKYKAIKNLDNLFLNIFRYQVSTKIKTIALSQGGDWIGGAQNQDWKGKISTKRKAMNSFFCLTDNPIQFVGRINEDVNTYTLQGSRGDIFLTLNQLSLRQKQTQTNQGGMTELYLDSGTYLKSFYSVIYAPYCVTVRMMGSHTRRLHHHINWNNCTPKILRENIKTGVK